MSEDRSELMFEILKKIQGDVGEIKRELGSQSMKISSLEDHFRGTLTTLYSIQADVAHLRNRVDRIETRLGLKDTEH